jgi:phosphoserine phosphatase
MAKFVDRLDEVKRITELAMGGAMNFRKALELRLTACNLSKTMFEQFTDQFHFHLVDGVEKLVQNLLAKGVDVYLVTLLMKIEAKHYYSAAKRDFINIRQVSGGFRPIVERVAKVLGIPPGRIFANCLIFNDNEEFTGVDRDEPTCDSGSPKVGKAAVCQQLKTQKGYEIIVMVGDGMTDAEAAPPADAFIGFGGAVVVNYFCVVKFCYNNNVKLGPRGGSTKSRLVCE